MTAWFDMADGTFAQDKPIKTEQGIGLRDNVKATAEGSANAPIVAAGWHPYDMTDVGDGADGEFYDFSTDGAASSAETPDFADGYEYMILADGISASVSGTNWNAQAYLATDAAYATAGSMLLLPGGGASLFIDGYLICRTPRLDRRSHIFDYSMQSSDASSGAASSSGSFTVTDSTAQKIGKMRFGFAAGNIDGGKLHLLRRREYLSG